MLKKSKNVKIIILKSKLSAGCRYIWHEPKVLSRRTCGISSWTSKHWVFTAYFIELRLKCSCYSSVFVLDLCSLHFGWQQGGLSLVLLWHFFLCTLISRPEKYSKLQIDVSATHIDLQNTYATTLLSSSDLVMIACTQIFLLRRAMSPFDPWIN